jgi:hypothetical protein
MRTASYSIAAEAAPTLVTLPVRSARPHPVARMPRCFPAPPGGSAVSNGRRDDRPRRPAASRAYCRAPSALAPFPAWAVSPLSRAVACPGVGRGAMRPDTRSPRSARAVAWAVRVALPRPLRFRWTGRPGFGAPVLASRPMGRSPSPLLPFPVPRRACARARCVTGGDLPFSPTPVPVGWRPPRLPPDRDAPRPGAVLRCRGARGSGRSARNDRKKVLSPKS